MIVEGIVFRLATPNSPGDPSLEALGIIRVEYLADSSSEALRWTCNIEEAKRFPTHLAAEKLAHGKGWHARVVSAADQVVPENRRPKDLDRDGGPPRVEGREDSCRAEAASRAGPSSGGVVRAENPRQRGERHGKPISPKAPAARKSRRPKDRLNALCASHSRVQRRDWVTDTYG